MRAYEVEHFIQDGEEVESHCDSCGQYETDIGTDKLLMVEIAKHFELTLCVPCSQKLIAALSGKPAGTVVGNVDHGTYQIV